MTEKADEIIDLLSGFFCLKRCKFKMIPRCTAHLIKILHLLFFFCGGGGGRGEIGWGINSQSHLTADCMVSLHLFLS